MRLLPLPHLQSATVSCFLRVGSRYETAETNGLSHFLEHMVYRGTQRHPQAHELSLAIERLGGTLDAATHVDFTSFDLTLPGESIVEGTHLIAEVLQRPLLTELRTEKQIIREEILEELNESGDQIDVDNVSRQLLYCDHPLGFSIAGPVRNLDRFGVDDLKAHHAAHYTSENAVVCVAGQFDSRAIEDALQGAFGKMAKGRERRKACSSFNGAAKERFRYVHDPGSQTEVRISFHTPGVRSPHAATFLLLDRILDDGLSTRVHRLICEERGLAYEAFAGNDTFEECGVFDFGASVEHKKVSPLVETLVELIDELRNAQPSIAEVEKAKRRYLWDLRTVRDDPEDASHFVGTSALFGLPEKLSAVAARVQTVTPEDIQRVAKDYFRIDQAYVTCVGVLDDDACNQLRGLIDA